MKKTRRPSDDAGMTLVELVVYASLSVLVLTVLLGVFLSASQTQAATRNRDVAAGTAQVATNSIQVGIRNASSFNIAGNLLRARVALVASAGWQCQAWALTTGGDLVYTTSSSSIAVPADYAGWTTLASKVSGSLASGALFQTQGATGNQLKYAFAVTVGAGTASQARVPVEGGAVAQARGTGSPASCW